MSPSCWLQHVPAGGGGEREEPRPTTTGHCGLLWTAGGRAQAAALFEEMELGTSGTCDAAGRWFDGPVVWGHESVRRGPQKRSQMVYHKPTLIGFGGRRSDVHPRRRRKGKRAVFLFWSRTSPFVSRPGSIDLAGHGPRSPIDLFYQGGGPAFLTSPSQPPRLR